MLTATNHRFVVERVRNITVVCFTIETLDEENLEAVAEELDSLSPPRRGARGPGMTTH